MIIKIFNQSKPINLVLGSFIIVLGFLFAFLFSDFQFNYNKIISFIVAVLSLLTIDFICKKNELSQQSSFPILFFALLFNLYLVNIDNYNIVFANFFTLLALRKIISLKSNKNNIQKIFDAGFWIGIATLFSFWSILFYLLLFVSIILYASENYKYYLVPLLCVFCLYILTNSFNLFVNQRFFQFQDTSVTLNFSTIINLKNNIIIGFVFFLTITSFVLLPTNIKTLIKKNKSSYYLLGVTIIIGILIFVLNLKMGSLLFLYFPLAIFLSVITEYTSKNWMQHAIVYTLLLGITLLYFI